MTTLSRRHVTVRGSRVTFRFRAKHRVEVRTSVVDAELAGAIKELVAQPGGARLFRHGRDGAPCAITGAVLNDYIREHMGEEFTAKDFRTWGGTLTAAVALAEHGVAETQSEAKRVIANVMRTVGDRLGNTPAVARASYVSPAVRRAVSRRTNDRAISTKTFAHREGARYRLEPGGAGTRQFASLVANPTCAQSRVIAPDVCGRVTRHYSNLQGGTSVARKTVLVSDISGAEIAEGKGATVRITFRDARKGVRELDLTDAEAEKLGGRQVARRGRRPKSAQ